MDCQIKATCTGETSYAVCTKYESTVNEDSKLKNIEIESKNIKLWLQVHKH